MINKVENGGNYLKIQSHINNDVFKELEHNKMRTIYFFYTYEEWSKNGKSSYPDKNDLELLNGYIKDHKNILRACSISGKILGVHEAGGKIAKRFCAAAVRAQGIPGAR
jgi:hypothetical protein